MTRALLTKGANPFKEDKEKKSIFFSSLDKSDIAGQNSPPSLFWLECLLACTDSNSPLYKIAKKEISLTTIERSIGKIDLLKARLSSPECSPYLKYLESRLEQGQPQQGLNGNRAAALLQETSALLDTVIDGLRKIKAEKEKTFRFNSVSLSTLFHSRPKNDAQFPQISSEDLVKKLHN